MAAHDKGKLATAQISQFKVWLDQNNIAWRDGKGEFELLQIKLTRGWLAIFRNAQGLITTPVQFREMIAAFKAKKPYQGGVKVGESDQDNAGFLEDLRDDIAMRALQGMLAYPGNEQWGHFATLPQKEAAEIAYGYADAMILARIQKSN